jgi:acetylornithine/N-succinyldiaminopimelate aminotransferase
LNFVSEREYDSEADGHDVFWILSIAVNALAGYAHPKLVEALTTRAGALWHLSNFIKSPNNRRCGQSW